MLKAHTHESDLGKEKEAGVRGGGADGVYGSGRTDNVGVYELAHDLALVFEGGLKGEEEVVGK